MHHRFCYWLLNVHQFVQPYLTMWHGAIYIYSVTHKKGSLAWEDVKDDSLLNRTSLTGSGAAQSSMISGLL